MANGLQTDDDERKMKIKLIALFKFRTINRKDPRSMGLIRMTRRTGRQFGSETVTAYLNIIIKY